MITEEYPFLPKENIYYQTKNGVLYCCDCVEILKKLPDKSFDLVLTDPPYGVRKKEEWDKKDYYLSKLSTWLKECIRVGKTTLWFTTDKMLPEVFKINSKDFSRIYVWNKPPGSQFAGASHNNIWYSVEFILLFGKLKKTRRDKKYGYACFNYRTVPEKKYGHPTTKPLGLIEDLLYFHSEPGEIVLDPFVGSGTTLVAAEKLGRKWVGVEIDKDYCDISVKRLKELEVQEKILWKENSIL